MQGSSRCVTITDIRLTCHRLILRGMETPRSAPSEHEVVLCELAPTGIAGLESYSPFCLKVHRALKGAGIPYTSRRGATPSAFRDLNPAAQVPVLLVGGVPVADSTRILRRIVELAPEAGLVPEDPRARAEAWLWEDWADRALSGWLVAARWADDRNWPRVRDAYFGAAPWLVRSLVVPRVRRRVVARLVASDVLRGGAAAAEEDFLAALDHLEQRAPLEGFWLTADRPTVADIALFAQLHSLRTELTPRQARAVAVRPALTDWLDRVEEATSSVARGRRGSHAIAA
jgi:glutathione S-transferase